MDLCTQLSGNNAPYVASQCLGNNGLEKLEFVRNKNAIDDYVDSNQEGTAASGHVINNHSFVCVTQTGSFRQITGSLIDDCGRRGIRSKRNLSVSLHLSSFHDMHVWVFVSIF